MRFDKFSLAVATFYSGIGGCDWGLKQAGFDVNFGVEYDSEIAQFYRLNHPNSTLFNCKVEDKNFSEFKGKIWGVHGSPPCQNFSLMRDPNYADRHDREESFNFVTAISQIMPVYVTLENVAIYGKSDVFGAVCDMMGSLGYYAIFSDVTCDHKVFNYLNFGGSQRRNRLIARWVHESHINNISYQLKGSNLLGNRYIYAPQFEPDYVKPVSWFDLIEPYIPTLRKGNFKAYQIEQLELKLFKPDTYYSLDKINMRTYLKYGIIDPTQPYWTITTSVQALLIKTPEIIEDKDQFFSQTISLEISPECFKLLQGFPVDSILSEKITLSKKMIGNAVPPAMIAGIWSKFQ